jgi:hypothetical protein
VPDLYTTVTNPVFYEDLVADSADGETNWSVSRHVRAGDLILLYVTAPVSAIVAAAEASDDAAQDDDPKSPWFGHFFCDMHDLRMLARPVTRAELVTAFPNWGYWRQPRNSIRVPGEFAAALEALLHTARRFE